MDSFFLSDPKIKDGISQSTEVFPQYWTLSEVLMVSYKITDGISHNTEVSPQYWTHAAVLKIL